ncbi:MAG: AAA family ATPase, partial [Gammaproteobacteria bacterium]|nr:AAA family ATPase [Gammaproteobacteria bacterium]
MRMSNTNTTLDMHPAFVSALNAMEKSKAHLFITGKAGTGKSTLLEYFHQNTKKKPVILAPTGVA